MTEVTPLRTPVRFPRVHTLIPCHDMVHASFSISLANLSAYTVASLPPAPSEYGNTMVKGTYVHRARQQLLQMAFLKNATHVLWLDADMVFPKESILRLLKHDKDVVGINYSHRGVPYEFVAIKKVAWDGGKPEKVITAPNSTGLEECEALGFGLVLMRMDALKAALPDPNVTPWFWYDKLDNGEQVGEDVRFCKFLTDAGLKIYVDHDLSKECAHQGMYDYECDTAFGVAQMEARKAAAGGA